MTKRLFDLFVCCSALLLLLPLFAVIGAVIKITSPGAVFYRGIRTGLRGRKFRIWKFRTMVANGESVGGGTTALDDPRVFPFGKFLRKFKLDELPQVFNVISGDMSIVGPRPELPKYTDRYSGDELLILTVRPGITDFSSIAFRDLAQVVGDADADRVYEEKVLTRKNQLRVLYVKERSLWLDLRLIIQTLCRIVWR